MNKKNPTLTREGLRLAEADGPQAMAWRQWGPYLSERSWGTVREDYSPDGDAWSFLTHDMARSKAYRWGEDGLGGLCDRYQLLCFSVALWNRKDPMLKERAFGVTPSEGNHGEDLKDYYFYLDSTPTHSYMRYLYKYPQAEFPYRRLIEDNQAKGGSGPEVELIDTGIFDEERYFDVFVIYAKASPDDICIRIEAYNRGPDDAPINIIPTLWFRNTWSWGAQLAQEPVITLAEHTDEYACFLADDTQAQRLPNLRVTYTLGPRYFYCESDGTPLFTDNETNKAKMYGANAADRQRYFKDAFHRHIINGEPCVNPERRGTKACVNYERIVPAGRSIRIELRMSPQRLNAPFADTDAVFERRRNEADEFYDAIHPAGASADERLIQRQAFAGLMWGKQSYIFDVDKWLHGDNPEFPPPRSRHHIRNNHWRHLNSLRILSMPDTWEYPWFAAWDLAFHTVPIALIDPASPRNSSGSCCSNNFSTRTDRYPRTNGNSAT